MQISSIPLRSVNPIMAFRSFFNATATLCLRIRSVVSPVWKVVCRLINSS